MKQLQLFSCLALFGLFESRCHSDLYICMCVWCVLYLRLNEMKPEVWAAIAAGTSPTPLFPLPPSPPGQANRIKAKPMWRVHSTRRGS